MLKFSLKTQINHRFYSDNQAFDFLIISTTNNSKLQVHSFDLTVGKLELKVSNTRDDILEKQIRQIALKYKK